MQTGNLTKATTFKKNTVVVNQIILPWYFDETYFTSNSMIVVYLCKIRTYLGYSLNFRQSYFWIFLAWLCYLEWSGFNGAPCWWKGLSTFYHSNDRGSICSLPEPWGRMLTGPNSLQSRFSASAPSIFSLYSPTDSFSQTHTFTHLSSILLHEYHKTHQNQMLP